MLSKYDIIDFMRKCPLLPMICAIKANFKMSAMGFQLQLLDPLPHDTSCNKSPVTGASLPVHFAIFVQTLNFDFLVRVA